MHLQLLNNSQLHFLLFYSKLYYIKMEGFACKLILYRMHIGNSKYVISTSLFVITPKTIQLQLRWTSAYLLMFSIRK